MNYTYDIVLNFDRDNLYDFFEWEEDDYPEFILKIPVFKIDESSFIDLKYNEVVVTTDLMQKIMDKTEVYDTKEIKFLKYACLFVSENGVIGVEFDETGKTYMKSLLSIDEESDIIEISKEYKYTLIDYKVSKINKIDDNFNTRKEIKRKEELENRINKIYLNKDFDKLKYIYYELFNEKKDDEVSIYYKLINLVRMNDKKINKINELISIMN